MEQIISLTAEQAQRAILLFYDLLPSELWEDQTKPSLARMETLSDRVKENASGDVRPFVNALLAEGNTERKGEMAKLLLQTFAQQDALRPYVEQALTRSAEPHMAPIPVDIGTLLIVLALLSVKMDVKTKWVKFHFEGAAPELVEKFTGLVKTLPSRLLGGPG